MMFVSSVRHYTTLRFVSSLSGSSRSRSPTATLAQRLRQAYGSSRRDHHLRFLSHYNSLLSSYQYVYLSRGSGKCPPQVSLFNFLVLTMIGNVGSTCEEGATLADFTSGCNSTVEASQVPPPTFRQCQPSTHAFPTLSRTRQTLGGCRGVVSPQYLKL